MLKVLSFLALIIMMNCTCTTNTDCISTSTTPTCKISVCSPCVTDEDCLKNINGFRCIK